MKPGMSVTPSSGTWCYAYVRCSETSRSHARCTGRLLMLPESCCLRVCLSMNCCLYTRYIGTAKEVDGDRLSNWLGDVWILRDVNLKMLKRVVNLKCLSLRTPRTTSILVLRVQVANQDRWRGSRLAPLLPGTVVLVVEHWFTSYKYLYPVLPMGRSVGIRDELRICHIIRREQASWFSFLFLYVVFPRLRFLNRK